ncbi:MAG: hypothetical protein IPH44_13865 [Myxococcales bacterium]|nr:hypothetical protein [Myxococcales bacterium]MBK7192459.1 hypothetical protein [Myxococcales bacterium]
MPRSPLGPTLAALALLVPVVARAQPAEPHRRGRVAFRFGMRGQQGGVMRGGFRLVLNLGFNVRGFELSVELDRQLGPDSRIVDNEGDAARWSEWVGSVRVARPVVLAKGLRAVTTIGPALVHYTATEVVDAALPASEASRSNLGVELIGALVWHSGPLVVMATAGVTAVPFGEELVVRAAAFRLPRHLEPIAGLGMGVVF